MDDIRTLLIQKELDFVKQKKIKGRRRFAPRYCSTSRGNDGKENDTYFNIETKKIEIISFTKEMAIVYFCDHVLENCKIKYRGELKHVNLYICLENMINEDNILSNDDKVSFVVDWFFTNGSLWLDEKINDLIYRPICLVGPLLSNNEIDTLSKKSFSCFGR